MKRILFVVALFVCLVSFGKINSIPKTSSNNIKKSAEKQLKESQNTIQLQTNSFVNDIALPDQIYMLSGVQNNIFIEPLIKRWRPYDDIVRFSGSAQYQRKLERLVSIINPVDSSTIEVELINTDKFHAVKKEKLSVLVGESGVDNGSVYASIIGDSYTNGAFFKDALLDNGYVPNLTLVGLRKVLGYTDQHDEGRGGWTLSWYFTATDGNVGYNPFMQPDNKRFWGSTGFWKDAWAVINGTDGGSFEPRYSNGRYDDYTPLFDVKTGFLLKPNQGDVMFDTSKDTFVEWNGKSWMSTSKDDYSWNFNYSTYLSMWELDAPQFLFVNLGLNDFRWNHVPEDIDFSKWNNQLETMYKSYLLAVPEGKFVVLTPCSTCGSLNNQDGRFVVRQNACMWSHRKNIIDNFDKRENESIFVVDTGIAIDSEYGYNELNDNAITKPFEKYIGNEKLYVQTGNPHPYLSYPEMGKALAAFIQKYR
jgi:hypothetical protein